MSSGTGATYTITATASGVGNFSHIDDVPHKLSRMHFAFKPQTPEQDVAVIHNLEGLIYTGGKKTSKYVRVVAEIQRDAWSKDERDELLKRMYSCIYRHCGASKAQKTDIIAQVIEIDDQATVIRNGRCGMWEASAANDDAQSVMSSASSQATLVAGR